ncbi:MAG: triose-phosphate isomerase [Acidimicrobiales bacterium]
MSRKPLVSGNWKMHHTHLEAIAVVQKLGLSLADADYRRVDVSLHPSFTALRSVQTVLDADDIPIALGAQDVHWEDGGAYTGEVSPVMLAKLKVTYVIVGHSERRQLFGETDDMVARKLRAVLAAGMVPIVCVGETLDEHDAGHAAARVTSQLDAALGGLGPEAVGRLVVAYEPVWAIGTGRNATPADAQAMASVIRGRAEALAGAGAAASLRVQYGGSVRSGNVADLMAGPDVDGALVGGASLDAAEFARIVTGGGSHP